MPTPREVSEYDHGTRSRYQHGCRCALCIEEMRRYWREGRRRRSKGPIPGDLHGTWNCYTNYGCRCGLCLEASQTQKEYQAQYRKDNKEKLQARQAEYYLKRKAETERQETLARKRRLAR